MGFRVGERVKIWSVERKENYSVCSISSTREDVGKIRNVVSKPAKNGKKYYVDFSSKFVRFIGNAHNMHPSAEQSIVIKGCDVCQIPYYDSNNNVVYPNYSFVVSDYELVGDAVVDREREMYSNSRPQFTSEPKYFDDSVLDSDTGLPF